MHLLRKAGSDGQLPFLVHRVSPVRYSFNISRLWRSIPRVLRTVIVIVALVMALGVAYTVTVARAPRETLKQFITNQVNRPHQVDIPPAVNDEVIAKIDDANQVGANAVMDFDQVDDAKQRIVDDKVVQNGDSAAEAPRRANIPQPKYPRFKGPQNDKQTAVVNAFKHAWNGYKKYAWGHDNLKPIAHGYSEWFGTGLTIIDSLDTLIIMRLDDEFDEARKWVGESLNLNRSVFVNFFEATIRMLGGLLSAFHLTGDRMFVDKAADLGHRLSAAYASKSAIPSSDVNLQSGFAKQPAWGGESSLSEVTSVQLEFRDLSRVIGNSSFEELTFGTSKRIHEVGCEKYDGLCGMFISPSSEKFRSDPTITMGARADSFYEYLLKQWMQTGKTIDWLRDDYNKSIQAMEKHLVRKSKPNNFTFVGEILTGGLYSPKMDHLACFISGSLALGALNGFPSSHLDLAKRIGEGCKQMYNTPTGLGPEIIHFNENDDVSHDINIKPLDAHCLLRPEAIEAWFYLYRATGDKKYQDWGWDAFQAMENHSKVDAGYASVVSVKRIPVAHRDPMESFFLAETLKYLYLLLADEQTDIPLDKYVFNTEAHPLPIYDH